MPTPLRKPIPHESALRHVSGEAVYVDDMPLPAGTLHGMVLASPHAHARILSRDASAALVVPGVHAVLFASDIPGHNQMGPVLHDEPLLATDTVHAVGQYVAAVIADSREAAREAIDRIVVSYEVLPAVLTLEEGIAKGDFHGNTHTIERGDVDGALASAAHVLTGEVDSGGQEHFYLESHCALAIPGEDRTIEVFSSTQHPSETQHVVAHTLGWGRHRVSVICPRMGGAFGGKETQANHWASLAALGATKTGRPCKFWLDRDQDMTLTGRRHPFHTDYKVGFDSQGVVSAFEARAYSNGGWCADLSLAILDRCLFHLDNGYWLPNVRLVGEVTKTNHVSNCAFRGFGGPQGMLVIELVMDRIANELGLDPVEVRRRNFYGDGRNNRCPYGQEVPDFRLSEMVPQLMESAAYAERRAQVDAFNGANAWVKRGLALTPVKFGISFTASFLNQAGCLVVLYSDGTAQLNHGGTEMGQGLYTKMLAVTSHTLGIPLQGVRNMPTSTEKVPNTSATAASSGSDLNGAAIRNACLELVGRLRPVAAEVLGVSEGELFVAAGDDVDRPEPPDGEAWAWTASGASMTFQEVCSAAYMRQISLSAEGFYRTPGIGYDRDKGQGRPFFYYAYGAACSEVEVNGLTGEWRLLRVDVLHDVGESLSPDIDIGQVEGGFIQGLGWLTTEELLWADDGRLLTHGPSTYKIPAIGEAPLEFHTHLVQRQPQPGVIYGSKAVGEPPFMLAISAHSALSQAASAFGANVQVAVPATPEAILFACEEARSGAAELAATGK